MTVATAMAKHAIKIIGSGDGDDAARDEKSPEVAMEIAEHALKNHRRQRQKWRSMP